VVPVSEPNDAGRAAVRQYFKEIIEQNKLYQSKVAALNFENLYTQESYLDAREANRMIKEVEDALQIEEDQVAALDGIATRCKERINALDWSEGEKRRFISGFESKYKETVASRTPLINSEKEWVTSISDLYSFVLENQGYFQRSGSEVLISNEHVLASFNARVEQANKLRETYQAVLKDFDQKQKANSAGLGLSAHDLGLSP
jgi:hypothetical protein